MSVVSTNIQHTASVITVTMGTHELNSVPSVSDNMSTDMAYYNYDSEFGEWFIVEPPAPISNTYGQQAVRGDIYGFTDNPEADYYINNLSELINVTSIDVFDIDAFKHYEEEFIDTRDWDDRHFLYKGRQLHKVAGVHKIMSFRQTPPANKCLYIKRKRRK